MSLYKLLQRKHYRRLHPLRRLPTLFVQKEEYPTSRKSLVIQDQLPRGYSILPSVSVRHSKKSFENPFQAFQNFANVAIPAFEMRGSLLSAIPTTIPAPAFCVR